VNSTSSDSNAELGAQAWWMQLVANARDYYSRSSLNTGTYMQVMVVCTAASGFYAHQLYIKHALLMLTKVALTIDSVELLYVTRTIVKLCVMIAIAGHKAV
jgi:secreted trypsin-like serine protease